MNFVCNTVDVAGLEPAYSQTLFSTS